MRAASKVSALSGGFGGFLTPGDALGSALARLGGSGANGLHELAVGAPFADLSDALWILHLAADGSVASELRIGTGFPGLALDPDNADQFGSSLAALGDLDLDGHLELVAGAPRDDQGGLNRGAAWVLFTGLAPLRPLPPGGGRPRR